MRGKLLKTIVILLCIISVFAGVEKLVRHVKSASNDSYISGCGMVPDYSRSSLSGDEKMPDYSVSYLSGDVEVLKEKRKGFVMQITVENKGESGEDFTGIVQVIFANPHSGYYTGSANCAYNTEMTLAAQEKKQFTITVPDFTVEHQDGLCALNFIDEAGNVIRTIPLYKVFDYPENKEIQVGVLSDNFEGLNYISANEYSMSVYNSRLCALKPVNLNNDNIKEHLNDFYFLIIDQFDMSLLSEENIQAVQDWVKAGGWLIIGTGEYAEQTLSGFDKDFIDVDILGISEPGEENIITENARYMNIYKEIDFTNMVVANLKDRSTNGFFYVSPYHPAICGSIGDGAVMIFYCSLGEDELQKLDIYAIKDIYRKVMDGPGDYLFEDYSDFSERLFAFMDKVNTEEKENELTEETRVYSVTTQKVDGNRADTYLLAYRDDTSLWEIRLKDNYEMASPGSSSSRFTDGTHGPNTDDYFHIVSNDSKGLSVGLKPGEYQDGFFMRKAGRRARVQFPVKI